MGKFVKFLAAIHRRLRKSANFSAKNFVDENPDDFEGWEFYGQTEAGIKTLFHTGVYQLYAGTNTGVIHSSDEGFQWQAAGLPHREILDVFQKDQQLYAGTDRGLFVNNSSTERWQRVDSPLLNKARINTIAENHYGALALGTNYGLIVKFQQQWDTAGLPHNGEVPTEVFSVRGYGGSFYAASNHGIFELMDSKKRAEKIADFVASKLAVSHNGTLFALTHDGLYRRERTGWKLVLSLSNITALAIGERDNVFVGTEDGKIYRSVDLGKSWKRASAGLDGASKITALAPSKFEEVYVGTDTGQVYRTAYG